MEENKISPPAGGAEVEQITEEIYEEEKVENRARKISAEALMILVIGVLLGIVIKTELGKQINIADQNVYAKQFYNFTEMEKAVAEKNSNPDAQEEIPQNGGSCSVQQ